MRRSLAVLLMFAGSPLSAANVSGAQASAVRPVPALAAPVAPVTALSDRLDSVLNAVSLRGYRQLGAQIESINAAYAQSAQPEHRLVLAAISRPQAEVVRTLQAAGVRAATARRAGALAEKVRASAPRDPALAGTVSRSTKLAAAPSAAASSDPAYARVKAVVDSVVSGWITPSTQTVPQPPAPPRAAAALAPAAPRPAPKIIEPKRPETPSPAWVRLTTRPPFWTRGWLLAAANAAILLVPAEHGLLGMTALFWFAWARAISARRAYDRRREKAAWIALGATLAWGALLLFAAAHNAGVDL